MEFTTKSFPVDANLSSELAKLQAAGWQLMPGSVPYAVYQLCRQPQTSGNIGKLVIDESKVQIVRAGEPFPQA